MNAPRDRPRHLLASIAHAGVDLVLPTACGGCGRAGRRWCARCADRLADVPIECHPRVVPRAPVWALGHYRGPHRGAILALKEHGRRDLHHPLGLALAAAIATLAGWGELPAARTLTLIPAPTRTLTARRRGGDPVTAIARVAADALGPRVAVHQMLVTAGSTRDSAGLDARARAANLSGAIRLRTPAASTRRPPHTAILVDDVLTTGATAAESVRVLARAGVEISAVVVIAAA